MAIYRYTMYKYIKSPSTWIVAAISMFIAGFLGGWLPFHVLSESTNKSVETYAMTVIAVVGGITSFLAIFVSVFAGFKAASMYKDEVEDGTFLVMLSKPQTRGKIIFQKWFALQTVTILYSFFTVLSFVIAVLVNDPGKDILAGGSIVSTLSSELGLVSLTMWGILVVIGLIFTSIALLLSTKLSVGSTVGISIALGVVIPVTSMISTFTAKPEYQAVDNSRIPLAKSMFSSGLEAIGQKVTGEIKKLGVSNLPGSNINTFKNGIEHLVTLTHDEIYGEIMDIINGKDGLSKIGIKTGDSDSFKASYFFDLNYQVHSLSSIASDLVVPTSFAAMTSNSKWGKMSGLPLTTEVTNAHPFEQGKIEEQLKNRMFINAIPLIKFGVESQQALLGSGLFELSDSKNKTSKLEVASAVKSSITSGDEINQLNQMLQFFNDLITKPLGCIMEQSMVAEYYNDSKYGYDKVKQAREAMYAEWETKISADTTISTEVQEGMKSALDNLDPTEITLVNDLISMAHYDDANNDNHFVEVKKVSYANKNYILYIYLAIALLLVPLSYFIVRKQDFR